jgi:hypothetical protein
MPLAALQAATLHYQLVVTASASKERFEAAKNAHEEMTQRELARH